MAIKKKGLGRGLGALGLESPKEIFESQPSQKDHGEEAGARLTELSVEQLRPGKYQPRTHMDPESIASLSASIKSQGLMSPLIVRSVGEGQWEIIAGDHVHMSRTYLAIQFVVCLVFLCDFFVRWAAAERPGRFFWRNLPFLLLSVPYLNILAWSGVGMTHDWGVLVGLIPLLRAFLAMVIIVRWLVSENRMRRLFFAYIFTVVVFTYISGLVFYDYEVLVNPKLHGFGNALWWAWMNVTTVGAEIFPVTAVGKVFCVLLPSLGMMFFPIFTTYVLQEYTHKKGE